MKKSKSVVKQRQKLLMEMLQQQGSLRVASTAQALNISELTIRRDFEELDKKGVLTRFHGGAKIAKGHVGLAAAEKNLSSEFVLRKQQIAQVAAGKITDGDTVFLNGGTTTLEVLRHIMQQDIRIVTNNAVATAIYPRQGAQLICTGGEYSAGNHSFIGDLAVPLLKIVYSNITILGVNGISSGYGITTHDYKETIINDLMLRRCKGTRIVVADGSKIGKSFCFTTAPLNMIDILITDSSANVDELARIHAGGPQIVLADLQK